MMPSTDGARPPVHVAVTGGAGQIGYSLLFRIAAGDLLGLDQPIILRLLEIEPAMKALEGVAMELDDCAFPLLHDIVLTSKGEKAFEGASWCLLVGAVPRKQGMERSDLLNVNAGIFGPQRTDPGRRQPLQHQLPDRAVERARDRTRALVCHDPARRESRPDDARSQ